MLRIRFLDLPHRHPHTFAIQSRLSNETIPDVFHISLVDDVVKTELSAAEKGRESDVELGVGEAL